MRGNKILTDKDEVVPETNWSEGTAERLVKEGFLVEVKGKEEKPKEPKEPKSEAPPKVDPPKVQVSTGKPEYKSIEKSGIVELLIKAGKTFNPADSKKALYDLL